jgi:hypothetical protein
VKLVNLYKVKSKQKHKVKSRQETQRMGKKLQRGMIEIQKQEVNNLSKKLDIYTQMRRNIIPLRNMI